MSALVASIFAAVWPFVVAVLGALGWGLYQRREGKKVAEQKQAEKRLRARTEAAAVEDAVAGRTAEENRERLKRYSPK